MSGYTWNMEKHEEMCHVSVDWRMVGIRGHLRGECAGWLYGMDMRVDMRVDTRGDMCGGWGVGGLCIWGRMR